MKNKSLNKWKSGSEDLLPSYGFLQTSSSNKAPDGMRILQDCRCDAYNRFVDWSIEAKTAQVTNESEIFDGFVPTMMQRCDGASIAIIGTKKMKKITVLTPCQGVKIVFSDAKSDAKCCGWPKLAPSWPKLNPSWPKLSPSWFKFAPNGPQVGASPNFAQVSSK